MRFMIRFIVVTATTLLLTQPALAYIGPGAGLSVLAAFWTLLTAIVAAIFFLLLWPLRQWLRRRRDGAHRAPAAATQGNAGVANAPVQGKGERAAWSGKAPVEPIDPIDPIDPPNPPNPGT